MHLVNSKQTKRTQFHNLRVLARSTLMSLDNVSGCHSTGKLAVCTRKVFVKPLRLCSSGSLLFIGCSLS